MAMNQGHVSLFLLLLGCWLPAQEQQERDDVLAGHSGHGEAFNEGPRQKAYLMQECGSVSFPVTCQLEENQKFFDQGVGQLHGFWYFEAERSFRQIAASETDCAMAYWGMAMANVDNPPRAAALIEEAVLRQEKTTPRERMWIDSLAKFYEVTPESARKNKSKPRSKDPSAKPEKREFKAKRKTRSAELAKSYEAIVAKYPDDVEPLAFLVNRKWLNRRAGIRTRDGEYEGIEKQLQKIFAKNPKHPAHHYRIHLWDKKDAKRALGSAALSGQSSPSIAHQWHMGGHIFAKLRRHEDAVWQQIASARVDHAHMMRDRVMPYQIHNYGHNNEWLCRSLNHIGQARNALALAKNMVELPRHPEKNKASESSSITGYGVTRLIETCRNYHMLSELASMHEAGYIDGGDGEDTRLRIAADLGSAFYLFGDKPRGDAQLAVVEAMKARFKESSAAKSKEKKDEKKDEKKADDKVDGNEERPVRRRRSSGRLSLRSINRRLNELRGMRDLANGEKEEAKKLLKRSRIPKLFLADCHLALGDAAEACKLVDAEAKRNPNRTEIMARQVLMHRAKGDDKRAREIFEKLRTIAGHCDLDVPMLQRLSEPAKECGFPEDWRRPRREPDDVGERPDLDALGPFRWQPVAARDFKLRTGDGRTVTLGDYRGKPVLVILYLGFGCLHCVEQLQHFHPMADAYRKAGIDIVAVGTDKPEGIAKSLAAMSPADRFGFPLLSDNEMRVFHEWAAYDGFEDVPLHGTFLLDSSGMIRWQDISYEPFDKPEWLLDECKRLLKLGRG